ncbi:hydrogen peroxide-inducible genes activator [Salisaeta longa]|uniref:hydrogen peroxide-inducible genes activator n=1 Tax=Salisaeta longa TaxID=503170 RepID=UPI0003B4E1FC|nr:hydrogen peroxide-inducible genes activator [Salisaeta longa]
MTLTQLTYLLAVVNHRNFSEAARQCGVTQPTLSMQVRKLEEALGVKLIDRSHQPVVPTGIGEQVAAQARRVLQSRDALEDIAAAAHNRVRGTLRMGMLPTLAPYLMPLLVPAVRAQYPEMTLELREWPTAVLLEALGEDRLDAALIATPPPAAAHETLLFEEPFVAYVHPEHRLAGRAFIAPTDLSIDDLWLLSDGHCFRDQVLAVCGDQERTERPAQFESGSLQTLVHMVERSGGMTLLPALAQCYLTDAQQETYVVPFEAPAPRRRIRLVQRRVHKAHLVTAFETALDAALPEQLGER